jgi:RimJ/RimL family protein N-acetyltransferase
MNKAPELKSERLKLVPVSSAHATKTYVSWMNDEEVNKYLDGGGEYTMEKLKAYLVDVVKKDLYFWAIHLNDNGKHIGNIKIDSISQRNGIGVYGILMGDKTEWGKGYGKEASQMVIDFCFNELGLRKISLGVIEDNEGAVQLYYNLGFINEGTLIKHGKYDGKYCNSLQMSLFNPAFDYSF